MSRQRPSNSAPINHCNPTSNAGESSARDGARGALSVREAGRKGGQRVRELIQRGRLVKQHPPRGGEQRP